jgi:RNA polymerase sigma factor (sigma-70 family)
MGGLATPTGKGGHLMQPDQVAVTVWNGLRETLRRYLVRAFPRLQDEAEDILQEAFLHAMERLRAGESNAVGDWPSWFRTVVRNRAIDRLRKWERRAFRQLSQQKNSRSSSRSSSSRETCSSTDPSDPTPSPATQTIEKERRTRQGLLLSDVLAAFCRYCEANPTRLPMKEAYERVLRGQSPKQIAQAMALKPEEVHQLIYRARHWMLDRIRQTDVDRSVFMTLFGHKKQAP